MKILTCLVLVCTVLVNVRSAQAGTVDYRNAVLADNPIVYYEFDEVAGTAAANSGSSGAGHTGSINGAVNLGNTSFAQGGTSFGFGGGHVSASALPTSLTEWTLEAWVNWDAAKTSQSHIFGNDQGGWNDDVLFGIGTETGSLGVPSSSVGLIQQGNPGSTRDVVAEPVSADVWHHVVATGSTTNGELKLYVDGVLVDTDGSLVNGVMLNGAGGFGTPFIAVGAARNVVDGGYRPFDGLIDEFAIYGTALDEGVILNHFAIGSMVIPEPHSIVMWSLMTLAFTGFGFYRRKRSS